MSCPHEEWSASLFCETTLRNDSASAEVCGRTGIATPSGLVGFCPVPSKAAAAAGESLAEEVHSLLQREREPTADELLHLPLAFGFQRGKLTPFLPACRSVGFSADHVISADGAATGPCEFARGRQHGKIADTSGRLLTGNDIVERGHEQRLPIDYPLNSPRPQSLKRPDAVDHRHEISLQPRGIIDDAVELRNRIIGSKDHRIERLGHGLELAETCRRVPKHEIEVERGDWSAVDGRGCVADQHGFQVVLFERAKNSAKEWGGVHDRKDTRRDAPRAKAADAKPDWSRW